ncbi:S41 family peptidase [Fibrella aquatica]|uniref:S41 family peptidase n=1 Tax=Fibrella aquatica TaxID=3242487 RepID=UPI00351FA747
MRLFHVIAFLLIIQVLSAQKRFTAQQLQSDFIILEKAYKSLHPGLYKYADSATVNRYFADCRNTLSNDQTLPATYLAIMKLTAQLQCGHSYPNFYNQEGDVKAMFEQKNCLPFQFRLVDNRLIVTRSAADNVPVGSDIRTINGVPVKTIIQTMLPLVRADGNNDGKRLKLLEISGQRYEYFDVLLPLLFPGNVPDFTLTMTNPGSKKNVTTRVDALKHTDRDALITAKYTLPKRVPGRFNWLDTETAVLQINTFANWDNTFDFSTFYDAAVKDFNQKNGQNLIIDIRQNEGGDSKMGHQLIRHLITSPIEINEQQDCWAYVSIDSTLSPYIDNQWAYSYRYRNTADFDRLPSGQYRAKKGSGARRIEPHPNHLTGRVFLLTSATNSSAAWQFVTAMKEHKLATLVGQTTGGNQKGITAGALFFMKLPNTGIEVDVPLIGMNYAEAAKRPNAGLAPDVYVRPTVDALMQGTDQEIDQVKTLIARKK